MQAGAPKSSLPELEAAIATSAACNAVKLALDGGAPVVLQLRAWLAGTGLADDHVQRLWVHNR